jgi:hypothetical protein
MTDTSLTFDLFKWSHAFVSHEKDTPLKNPFGVEIARKQYQVSNVVFNASNTKLLCKLLDRGGHSFILEGASLKGAVFGGTLSLIQAGMIAKLPTTTVIKKGALGLMAFQNKLPIQGKGRAIRLTLVTRNA